MNIIFGVLKKTRKHLTIVMPLAVTICLLAGCLSTRSVDVMTDKKIITEKNVLNFKYSLMLNFKKGKGMDSISARSIEDQLVSMLRTEGLNVTSLYDEAEVRYSEASALSEDYMIYCIIKIDFGDFENPYKGSEYNIYKDGGYQTVVSAHYYILDMNELKKTAQNIIDETNKNIDDMNNQMKKDKNGKKTLFEKKSWSNKYAIDLLRDYLPVYLSSIYSDSSVEKASEMILYHSFIWTKGFPEGTSFNKAIAPSINSNADNFFTKLTGLDSYWDRNPE